MSHPQLISRFSHVMRPRSDPHHLPDREQFPCGPTPHIPLNIRRLTTNMPHIDMHQLVSESAPAFDLEKVSFKVDPTTVSGPAHARR